jgi:hypothetical protein
MAGRVSQNVVEVVAGVGVAPTLGRSAQVVLELAVTIAAAAPVPPPVTITGPPIPSGGGGKFFLASYNCFDCLLQLQQCIWDKIWCGGVKTCHPIMTREQKKRKLMIRFRRNF